MSKYFSMKEFHYASIVNCTKLLLKVPEKFTKISARSTIGGSFEINLQEAEKQDIFFHFEDLRIYGLELSTTVNGQICNGTNEMIGRMRLPEEEISYRKYFDKSSGFMSKYYSKYD